MLRKFLVAAGAMLIWPLGAFAADVALISAVRGDVKMSRPAKPEWRKASVMQGLPAGSKVQVGAGGQATIIIMRSGARYQLAGGSVVAVSGEGCQGVSGPAPKALKSLAVRHQRILQGSLVAGGRSATTIVRSGPKEMTLLSLANTSILEGPVVFKWVPVPEATSYKVVLWNDNNERVWQTEVTTPTVTYPTDAPALKPDVDYLWEVTTNVKDTAYKKEGSFGILTAEKRQAINEELEGLKEIEDEQMADLLRAELFYNNNLMDDAIANYQALAVKYPESATVHTVLAELLAGQTRNEDSKKHKEKADKLSEAAE